MFVLGVEAGLRYSDPGVVEARLAAVAADFARALPDATARPALAFNRMEEWGADGRIKPGAPVHSPFIRRKEKLDLE